MNHKEFQAEVTRWASLNGYLVYFTYRSTRSPAGYPDLTFARADPPDFVIAELKIPPDKATPAQQEWLDTLAQAGVECHVWTPADMDAIIARLARPRSRPHVHLR